MPINIFTTMQKGFLVNSLIFQETSQQKFWKHACHVGHFLQEFGSFSEYNIKKNFLINCLLCVCVFVDLIPIE